MEDVSATADGLEAGRAGKGRGRGVTKGGQQQQCSPGTVPCAAWTRANARCSGGTAELECQAKLKSVPSSPCHAEGHGGVELLIFHFFYFSPNSAQFVAEAHRLTISGVTVGNPRLL